MTYVSTVSAVVVLESSLMLYKHFHLTKWTLAYTSCETQVAFEDMYTTLLDVDGPEAADRLRRSMHVKTDDALPEEQEWLNSPSA